MTDLEKGAVLILVQVVPLAVGYGLKEKGFAREDWGRPISRFVIWFFNTAVAVLAVWVLPRRPEMAKLPLIAVMFGTAITFVALAMARLHPRHTRPDRGAYIVASSISNYGFTLGGFICLIFLSEKALAMSVVYIFPLVGFIYLVWFPIARYYGTYARKVTPFQSFIMAFKDITTLPLLGTLVGLGLNLAGVERPGFLGPTNAVLVYSGTATSMFTIGITLQLGSVGGYRAESLSVAITKFIIGPLLGYGVAKLLGASQLQTQVTVILSSVPVGLFASFASSIFGLNRNLANSMFVINTAAYLAIVLPLLVWLLSRIG